jgi:hypothetical protein
MDNVTLTLEDCYVGSDRNHSGKTVFQRNRATALLTLVEHRRIAR